MKRFYFYFTVFYIITYVSGIDYIAHMSLFVTLFMGFGAFALCILCSTFMNEELFSEYQDILKKMGYHEVRNSFDDFRVLENENVDAPDLNTEFVFDKNNKMKQFKKSREPTSFKTNVGILP